MKMSLRRFTFGSLAVVLSVSMVLAGCSSNQATPPKKPTGPVVGGTYITTSIGDAKILIPSLDADNASSTVIGYIYDGLFAWDDKLQPQPALAKSWTVEQDKIYTFKLREDVKWHDGTPFTAEDVVFTFNSIAHPKYSGVRFSNYTSFKGWKELSEAYGAARADFKDKKIDEAGRDAQMAAAYAKVVAAGSVTASDKYTVRVELAEPYAPIFISLGTGIIPKHLLEQYLDKDLKNAPQASKPVGTGAYKFVEWVKDDRVVLQRNPDWKWGVKGQANNIEKVIVKVTPDQQAGMVALETGESDSNAILPDNLDHFKNNVKQVNVVTGQTFSYTYMGYNHKNPMFADVRVRQAITQSINRQEIVNEILKGQGAVAHGHFSPIRWDYNPNVPTFAYDTTKAAQLLDEAGWKLGADGLRANKDGQKMTFELATNAGNKARENSAVIIQQALKKMGITVTLNYMEWNAFLDHVDSDKKQAYILGWSLGFDPDSTVIFHSKGGFAAMHGYSNPKIDQLYEKGIKVADIAARKAIYGEAQEILARDQVYTWLFFSNAIQGVNTRVGGVPDKIGPAGLSWQFEEWFLRDTRTTN